MTSVRAGGRERENPPHDLPISRSPVFSISRSPEDRAMRNEIAELLKIPGASLECEDDFDAVNELVRGRGWSDGLPVVPPTARRVERMPAYLARPRHVTGGHI